MELIYVYTRSFRNLKRIGFNFSTKRKILFDDETLKLSIEHIDEPRKDFFGKKISNVTGIIGVNGSGKSNLLELICYLTKGSSKKFDDFIIIYEDDNGDYIYKKNMIIGFIDGTFKSIDAAKSIPALSVIYFSNILDGREHRFNRDIIDVSQMATKSVNRKSDAFNQLKFLLSDMYSGSDLDRPSDLLLSFRTDLTLKRGLIDLLHKESKIFKVVDRYKVGFLRSKPIDQFRYGVRFSLFFHCLNYVFLNYEEHAPHQVSSDKQIYADFIEEISNRFFLKGQIESIQEIHVALEKFLERFIFEFGHIGSMQKTDFNQFLNLDNIADVLSPVVFSEKISRRKFFKVNFNSRNRKFLKEFSVLLDFPDVLDVEWAGISSGHKAFLNLFAQLYSSQRRTSQHDYILICIDEGDLYLHPEWQREFLFRLIKFLNRVIDKKVQLILTTHSPFLISDLPKENIILVGKRNDRDQTLQLDKIELRQTFAANIYDLYNGPFVLKESKISEFALQKIKCVISSLSDPDLNSGKLEEIRGVISAIGDEPVYRKLQEMLQNAENRM